VRRGAASADAATGGKIARQEELEEARRTGVQQPEAIPARLHLEEGLYLAVDEELVAQDAVQIEKIECQQAVAVGIQLVGEDQRNVEPLHKAREAKTGSFIAGVKLVRVPRLIVEEQEESEETLVCILGSKVDAVVVVPQRAHRFVDIAVGADMV